MEFGLKWRRAKAVTTSIALAYFNINVDFIVNCMYFTIAFTLYFILFSRYACKALPSSALGGTIQIFAVIVTERKE